MSDFFHETEELDPLDRELIDAYLEVGRPIDVLADSPDLEYLTAIVQRGGDNRDSSELLRCLFNLRKAGKLPAIPKIDTGNERRPLIGVNLNCLARRKDMPVQSFLESGYHECLFHAGAIPVLVPPIPDIRAIERVLEFLDGCVLVGGDDLDPRRDGYMLHPSVRLLDERREEFDRLLVDVIAEKQMPVLGIGVGAQLLNVSQGGTLFLHLPEDFPRGLPHFDPSDPNHRHALAVVPGTLMGRVYGEGEVRVNSMHHMAIDDVAPGFTVTAYSPDGVVEAIESTRPEWFAVGVQFHPENSMASALDRRIFGEFLAGCKQVAAARDRTPASPKSACEVHWEPWR